MSRQHSSARQVLSKLERDRACLFVKTGAIASGFRSKGGIQIRADQFILADAIAECAKTKPFIQILGKVDRPQNQGFTAHVVCLVYMHICIRVYIGQVIDFVKIWCCRLAGSTLDRDSDQ